MITSLLLSIQLAAAAEPWRVGLFVGNNEGTTGQERLLFAASDAEKMHDLFVQFGGVPSNRAVLVENGTRRDLEKALVKLREELLVAEQSGAHTEVVFYYSGHGDAGGLQLGTTRVEHEELRRWLENTGADVRVVLLDACQSGGAVRSKGGARGPSYDFTVAAEEVKGTAILTSSAASELSQESEELGGGFFTYYLHGALMGAADADGSGDVTLPEAYAWVHGQTAFASRSAPSQQTPGFDLDLSGSGALVLTSLHSGTGTLAFSGGLEGTYSVWDQGRKRYIAEVSAGDRLQVAPGTYFIHHRMPGWVDEAAYEVIVEDVVQVRPMDFLTLAYEDTAARGELDKQIRKAERPDAAVRFAVGSRVFNPAKVQGQYYPTHPIAGIDVRVLPSRRRRLFYGADLLSGGGSGDLLVAPSVTVPVSAQSYSLGGSVGVATRERLLRAGIGLRGEVVVLVRDTETFDNAQGIVTVAPGWTTWAGVQYGRFTADLNLSSMLIPQRWDDQEALPTYTEIVLAGGWRF